MGVSPEPTCMAYSPMTPSGAPGSNGSAARRRAIATMRTFKGRSMRSPPTSRRISTSIACSDQRDEEDEQPERRDLHGAGRLVNAKRAADVGSGRLFSPLPDPAVLGERAMIGTRP